MPAGGDLLPEVRIRSSLDIVRAELDAALASGYYADTPPDLIEGRICAREALAIITKFRDEIAGDGDMTDMAD